MALSVEREYAPDFQRQVAALLVLLMKTPAAVTFDGQPSTETKEPSGVPRSNSPS
jgi:hypothetical protein